MAMSQLDTTLIGIEPKRLATHDAGHSISTHGSASRRSNRDPEKRVTTLAQAPALIERMSAAKEVILGKSCRLPAVAITLIQQPRKALSSQAPGTGMKVSAASVESSVRTLGPQALRGANASARPRAAHRSAGGTIPPVMWRSLERETTRR